MDALAILGQSNASRFWSESSSGLTPAPNTFMWNTAGSGWITPVNSLIAFCNALNAATGKPVYVLPCAVSGSALLAEAAVSAGYWLDPAATSPLDKFKTALTASGANLKAIWWVQGESECQFGSSMEHYLSGLVQLQTIISGYAGKRPADIPFLVSPVGNGVTVYNGRRILDAQLGALGSPGIVRGPEYYDLAVDTGLIHLTEAARNTFAQRGAAAFTPILGISPSAGQYTLGLQCVQNPVANSTATVSAHGLSAKPDNVIFWLECLTADAGYNPGDRVYQNNFNYCAAAGDATNVTIVTCERSVAVNAKGTHLLTNIVPANWKAVAQPILGY